MNIDSFLVKLILLVVPGYFGYSIASLLRTSAPSDIKESQSIRFLNIFLFTVIAYILFDATFTLLAQFGVPSRPSILDFFYSSTTALTVIDILFLMGFSAAIGIIYAVIDNTGLLFKLFRFLRVTKNASRTDVWSHLVKSEGSEWVIVRDFENKMVYHGHIDRYSETDNPRELLLWDVDVYAAGKKKKLYHSEYVYLSRDQFKFSIEVNSKE